MPNQRFIELARRLGEDLLKERSIQPLITTATTQFTQTPEDIFILSYNDFGKELIQKSNELFKDTKAEIPLKDRGEVPNMYILKRLALITTIYNNPQLKSTNLWPITPLQSELLLKENKLHNPEKYWEDLALIWYDTSDEGKNPKEAKALHESLKQNRDDLNLSNSDLDSKLLIVNPGLEKDSSMPYGVKPIILPGLTQVYQHETLNKIGDHKFEYGLQYGLPSPGKLGQGSRTLYMPSENNKIGLMLLCRYWDFGLYARVDDLADSGTGGRVSFAHQK